MEIATGLAATFLAHTKVHFAPPADSSALERQLTHAWEAARAQWPGVTLAAEAFVQHIAARLPEVAPQSSVEQSLEQMSLAELYLACACLRGNPAAIESFERNYLAKLPALLRGRKQAEAMVDEVCQLARVKFLVPTANSSPKLAEYTGRGSLMSWVRVTAVRIAMKLRSADKPASEQEPDTVFQALPAPGADAELDLIRQRHHAAFRQAVREAFSALTDEERHLLRLYFVDQLSTYELGSLFRVNQATISRWLKSARQTIYEDTLRRLQARLGLTTRDFKSFLAVLDSHLDLSISQLLGEEDDVPPTPEHE